jgi:hypothetical protein
VRQDETGFAEFYRASHQRCLRAVIAGAGTSVSLAAWSVRADGGGSVTVTPRELGPLGPQMAVIPQGHYRGCA